MRREIVLGVTIVLTACTASAWGPGHDTVARCLLRRLPDELTARMRPEWKTVYEEASHLPDAGSTNILVFADRAPLMALGWTGAMELHRTPLRFGLFDRLVDAIRRDDAYSQFMLLAALSHVNADPAACNHNPVVQSGSYIWGVEGLCIYPYLGLDFASVEETPLMRAVMDRRLAEVPAPVLPERLTYLDCYAYLVRLQWEAAELCNGRGADVMVFSAALKAGDASAEEKLAEALCDLGMYAVEKTLWCYAAARRLAAEGSEPPTGFDAKTFAERIEAEMIPVFLKRPLGADGHLRPYLPEPGVRYDVLVLADSLAHMDAGVLAPASRILAPQAVCSLRHVRPDLRSALVDIRDVRDGRLDPSVTRLLVVFGERIKSYLGFDAAGLQTELVAYARKGGRLLWVNGVPPKGLADGLVAAMTEPNPNGASYCNERYWVPQRELVGTTLSWLSPQPPQPPQTPQTSQTPQTLQTSQTLQTLSLTFLRRPTGMAGWYWEGSHVAFDPARLPADAQMLMTFASPELSCTVGVAAPKGAPTFAYLPTAAFFPYVLTREKPSLTNFELRFDSAGEAVLRRVANLLLGAPAGDRIRKPKQEGTRK